MAQLPQSAIDWDRFMEGLTGKANVDFGNINNKLADSFLSKLAPDRSKGVIYVDPYNTGDIPTTESTVTMPAEGYLTVNLYGFYTNHAYLYINEKKMGDVTSAGNAYVNSLTGEYRVSKGDVVRYKSGYGGQGTSGTQLVIFYPLKGAN